MKRILLLIVAAVLTVCSCSKDGSSSNNSLSGTNWKYSNEILQFTSGTSVTITAIKSNDTATGTYTLSGSRVTFKDLVLETSFLDFAYDYAEINGNMMTVTYHYIFGGEETTQSRIYEKQ